MRARNLQATEGERSNIGGTDEYRALELGTRGMLESTAEGVQ